MKGLEYYATRRDDIIAFVPPDARRILDVGCGAGLTGKTIKENSAHEVEVTGIEAHPGSAKAARENIDTVLVGDAEALKLPFGEGYFDCIIYGDILEHLIDPWGFLAGNSAFLKLGGTAIASIPNIAHYRTIKMLARKEWNYEERGILDKTHLRFFTLKSIESMFRQCGFNITKIERKISGSKVKKTLNKLLFGAISDYLTEQYIIIAKKTT